MVRVLKKVIIPVYVF